MNVPYTDLRRNFLLHKEEYEEAVLRVLNSGWYILGKEMEDFEQQFASYLGIRHCVALNSGTDALILAIRALGIGEGDEVIVPANTYIATVIGITENQATPVFVDADRYMEIDVDAIEAHISNRTKAIMVTHLYGTPARMDFIKEIAKKNNLYLIEDCAQSHGAKYDEQFTGKFGIMGCFSFYPTKPLGALGDAGAIVTNDDDIAEKLRMIRNYGSKVKYYNEIDGVNSRMDEIQAALLKVGLEHLEESNEERCRIASRYNKEILSSKVILPPHYDKSKSVYHLFPVLVEDRDCFLSYLSRNGIKTAIHYPIPPYVAQCNEGWGYKWSDYKNAEYYAKHELSLPIYAGMPEEEVNYVIEVVNGYC